MNTENKTYTIQADGQVYKFTIFANITEPCPHCGIPACGREDVLWYEQNSEHIALIFDGAAFDVMAEEFFTKYKHNKGVIPHFLHDWLCCQGWEECWDYKGYPLDVDDILASINLLKTIHYDEIFEHTAKCLLYMMEQFVELAKKSGEGLRIVRG